MNKKKGIILGAAIATSVVGTLTSVLFTKRVSKGWTDQARAMADRLLEKKETSHKNLILGSVAGGLVGVLTALLLAPKSGKDMIKVLAKPFQHKKEELVTHPKKMAKSPKKKVAKAPIHATAKKRASKKTPIKTDIGSDIESKIG